MGEIKIIFKAKLQCDIKFICIGFFLLTSSCIFFADSQMKIYKALPLLFKSWAYPPQKIKNLGGGGVNWLLDSPALDSKGFPIHSFNTPSQKKVFPGSPQKLSLKNFFYILSRRIQNHVPPCQHCKQSPSIE